VRMSASHCCEPLISSDHLIIELIYLAVVTLPNCDESRLIASLFMMHLSLHISDSFFSS